MDHRLLLTLAVCACGCNATVSPPVTPGSGGSSAAASSGAGSSGSSAAGSSGSSSGAGASSSGGPSSGATGSSAGSSGVSSSGASSSSSTGSSSSSSGGTTATVHFIGRADDSDPAGPSFGWPGSALAARFTGTSLRASIADQGTNFWAVVIDGAAPTTLSTSNAQIEYVLAERLADATHDVWLEKRTESSVGTVQFRGFTVDPGRALVPSPAPFTRMIEYVGDSITCGYGNEGAGPGCGFSPDTEDEYLAYGAVAARALNAAHVGISYSGIGVLRNYDGSTTEIMPDRYPRIFAGDPSRPWGFSFEPDVVVLNLGTNDFARGDPGQAYTAAYLAFVGQVRGHYPDAYLLLAVGSMLTGANRSAALADAQSVVASRVGAGDTRVGLVDLGVQSASDGYGCDSHPSVATDQKMADALVAAIHDAVGW